MTDIALHIVHLQKSYASVNAVADLSLQVSPGEIFGLIGPDGAGKTTAMRIVCGLLLPDGGSVSVMGNDPFKQTQAVKEVIGYMPQRFSLYPDLSIAENIRFFADLYLVPKRERIQREERLMQFSRLGQFRTRRAGKLSGGMKQKLALMCTLIHTPKVLILDEPTTGVDPVSRREFWELLKELAGDGIALLVSTPYMDEAGMCDHVALMHKGRVIAAGAPDDLTRLFPHKLARVAGEDLQKVAAALSQYRTLRFGDCLHVVYDDPGAEAALRAATKAAGATFEPMQPTIEDTFMALVKE